MTKMFSTTKVSADVLEQLATMAKEASSRAYAPYSKFKVGAAVCAENASGTRANFAGSNTENANYTLTLHAEHSAIAKAVEAGYTNVLVVVIYTPTGEHATAPCGSCRQVIFEFGPTAVVIATCDGPIAERWNMTKLLPDAFGPSNLGK